MYHRFYDFFGSSEVMNYSKFVEKIRCINANANEPKAVYVRTYGCVQNIAESEKIKGLFSNMGYAICTKINEASVILLNTCAIREHAEKRVLGNIGEIKHIKESNPNVIIILCGCMTQQPHISKTIRKVYPFVDLIFGTNFYEEFPEILYKKLIGELDDFQIPKKLPTVKINEEIAVLRDSKVHANVPIMYGCENFCSYCIVPFVKGPERSRDFDTIICEVRNLVKSGYKKVTLLGQNVNSYGKNLNKNFSDLLSEIDKINGNFWVDFMSSHPKDFSKEIIDVIANSTHICNHIHLPVQSGSNKILESMNRKYTRENYLKIIVYAKNKIQDLALTSDVIVGFPGETEKDFRETVSLIEQVRFSGLFTFIYSKRIGTRAATMEDNTSRLEKNARLMELIEIQKSISKGIHEKYVGKSLETLIYNDNVTGKIFAKTKNNLNVEIPELSNHSNESIFDFFGKFVKIGIIGAKNSALIGEIVSS